MNEENNQFENDEQQTDNYYNGEPQESRKGEGQGFGIASMVCGILAVIMACCMTYLGVTLGIVAIVLGIVQIVKNQKRGMAIAGIICGAIGLIASVAMILFATYLISTGVYDEMINEIVNEYSKL